MQALQQGATRAASRLRDGAGDAKEQQDSLQRQLAEAAQRLPQRPRAADGSEDVADGYGGGEAAEDVGMTDAAADAKPASLEELNVSRKALLVCLPSTEIQCDASTLMGAADCR